MRFSAKRGRPRRTHPTKDCGTPELIRKRQQMITLEPLDICLTKGLITKDDHWAGLHLRWLYTLRFGAPTLSSVDLSQPDGKNITQEDPAWQQARECEYKEALAAMKHSMIRSLVIDICIFHHHPLFLRLPHTAWHHSENAVYREYSAFKEGLERLFHSFGQSVASGVVYYR